MVGGVDSALGRELAQALGGPSRVGRARPGLTVAGAQQAALVSLEEDLDGAAARLGPGGDSVPTPAPDPEAPPARPVLAVSSAIVSVSQ